LATPALVGLLLLGSLHSEENAPELRMGATRTLFRGGDAAAAEAALQLISSMVFTQTGVHVQCTPVSDSQSLAKEMDAGNCSLGLMPGVEFAWLTKHNAALQPMLLPCNEKIALKAFLVIRKDSPAQSLADLKNKRLSFPQLSFNHSYLFLDKAIRQAGHDPVKFFSACDVTANPDVALEAVVEGNADAAVVDEVALEVYKDRKPGRAKRMRTLMESSKFPCAVLVCKPEMAKTEAVRKVQQGLATAHERTAGKQMLSLMRLSNFAPITPEYQQLLKDVLKEFPEPVEPVNFTKLSNRETTEQR
jgi:ABC-type phosphate/phosphonate transport system substrate-binding protein